MQIRQNPHILIVPDSYKSNLSSHRVAQIIEANFRARFPQATIEAYPMADGGESSSEIVGQLLGAERHELTVCGPEATPVTGFYYLGEFNTPTGAKIKRAFVELAAASGFALATSPKETATRATTFGTGELIKHAISSGAAEVCLFLGGSATTDCGVGFAKALGWNFVDSRGNLLPGPSSEDKNPDYDKVYPGEELEKIAEIRPPQGDSTLRDIKIIGITDVRNPLFGPQGAAHIYGPQKGAGTEAVIALDRGLRNVAAIFANSFKQQLAEIPGTGAAGGAGFGVLAFLGGTIQDGPSFFLDLIEFDRKLPSLDLVITGEGKVDSQSMRGKLLHELLTRTAKTNVQLISLAGVSDLRPEDLLEHRNFHAFGLGHVACLTDSELALDLLSRQIAQLL